MKLSIGPAPAVRIKPYTAQGFSLVELIVGMAIAMIMFLIISFVFINFENQKRVTTLSSDTQSSGIMAIFEMEQAIRSAGAGIVSEDSFDCLPANTWSYYTTASPAATTSPVPGYGQFFAPVVITSGAGNASDQLEVRVGAPVANASPSELASDLPNSSTEINVKRGTGYPLGSVLMVVNGDRCQVMEVTGIPDALQPNRMSILPAASGNTWNPSVAYKQSPPPPITTWPDFPKNGTYVYAPGAMTFRTYTVNASGQLQALNSKADVASSTDVLVGDVVRFHAQYGVSSAVGVQDIQKWVEPVLGGSYETNWDPGSLDSNKVKRIKAIRLVIVLRSPKLEPGNVTNTCTNNAGVNNGPCAWDECVNVASCTAANPAPLIDLSADANWQRYRYRVFQTIIPLRNTISAGV